MAEEKTTTLPPLGEPIGSGYQTTIGGQPALDSYLVDDDTSIRQPARPGTGMTGSRHAGTVCRKSRRAGRGMRRPGFNPDGHDY